MPSPLSDLTPAALADVDVATVAEHTDGTPSSVEQCLDDALAVAAEFAESYGVAVDAPPTVVFDPLKQGVRFDPRPVRDDPPRLVLGSSREEPIGGHAVLARESAGPSLLSVLCDGLVRTANQELAAHFFAAYDAVREATADEVLEVVDAGAAGDRTGDAGGSAGADFADSSDPDAIPPTTALYAEYLGRERPGVIAALERHEATTVPDAAATVRLFDPRTQTVAPAVDEAFARAFEFYLEAEAPDPELRAAYLDAWREQYREAGTLDESAFGLVARSVFGRVERRAGGAAADAADGDARRDRGADEATGDGATPAGDPVVSPAVRPGLERGLALRRPLLARADLSSLRPE